MAEAFVQLWLVRLMLWLLPFSIWKRYLLVPAPVSNSDIRPFNRNKVLLISRAIESMSRCLPGATCLVRALAAQRMLIRHGQNCELHIGVAGRKDGRLDAHAWIQVEGCVVVGNGADLSKFVSLPLQVGGKQS
jgi:hypothetical protein